MPYSSSQVFPKWDSLLLTAGSFGEDQSSVEAPPKHSMLSAWWSFIPLHALHAKTCSTHGLGNSGVRMHPQSKRASYELRYYHLKISFSMVTTVMQGHFPAKPPLLPPSLALSPALLLFLLFFFSFFKHATSKEKMKTFKIITV